MCWYDHQYIIIKCTFLRQIYHSGVYTGHRQCNRNRKYYIHNYWDYMQVQPTTDSYNNQVLIHQTVHRQLTNQ